MSYAHCNWSVTMFILGYANKVVMSQHISQSYFIKEIENIYYNLMQIITLLQLIYVQATKETATELGQLRTDDGIKETVIQINNCRYTILLRACSVS